MPIPDPEAVIILQSSLEAALTLARCLVADGEIEAARVIAMFKGAYETSTNIKPKKPAANSRKYK